MVLLALGVIVLSATTLVYHYRSSQPRSLTETPAEPNGDSKKTELKTNGGKPDSPLLNGSTINGRSDEDVKRDAPRIGTVTDDGEDEPTTPKATEKPNSGSLSPQERSDKRAIPPPPPPTLLNGRPKTSNSSSVAPLPSTMPPPPRPSSKPSVPKPSSSLRPPPSTASALRAPSTTTTKTSLSPTTGSLAPSTSTLSPSSRPSKKVLLKPGHSPLDWAALTSSPPNPYLLRGPDVPPNRLIRVPPSMLKAHTGRKGKTAWGVWQGRVYNLSPYMDFHPGGVDQLMRGAGKEKEGERLFMEVHPWINWENMLGGCMVGILVAEGEGEGQGGDDGGGGDKMEEMD